MATSMNIGGQDDEFNRYKMPSVIAKVEGRGNGIKTRLVNCFEVARALHRPPGYVCKFFGCELGAQTKIDDADGTYIVNGSFSQQLLQDTLKKFIEMFVVCQSCNLPETDLKLRRGNVITQACNACGAENPCDMTHKLCTYILNNPPDGKKKKTDGKRDKAARREAKKSKKVKDFKKDSEKGLTSDTNTNSNGHHHATSTVVDSTAAAVDDIPDTIGLIGDFSYNDDITFDNPVDVENDDDVQWSVDTSAEAEQARKRELGAAASILERGSTNTTTGDTANGDGYSMDDERDHILKLRAYIDDGKKPLKVLSKAEKIFGEDDAIRGLMMAAIYDEALAAIPDSIGARIVPVFQFLGKPMSKDAQTEFLKFLNWAAKVDDGKLVAVLPHMLKKMYDSEVMEEEVVFKWHENDASEETKKATQVIIDWLKEEDDDDDDDDDDDEEDDESESE